MSALHGQLKVRVKERIEKRDGGYKARELSPHSRRDVSECRHAAGSYSEVVYREEEQTHSPDSCSPEHWERERGKEGSGEGGREEREEERR